MSSPDVQALPTVLDSADSVAQLRAFEFMLVDAEGHIRSWSEALTALFGYASQDILGRPVETLVPGHARGRHESWRDALFEKKGFERLGRDGFRRMGLEVAGLHRDGHSIDIGIALSPLQLDLGAFVLCSITPAGENSRAQQSLLQSERRLAELVDNMSQGVALWDAEDRLVVWNSAYERMQSDLLSVIRRGVRFEDVVRFAAPLRAREGNTESAEAHVQARMAAHRGGGERLLRARSDGGYHVIDEAVLSDGAVAETFTDVTELTKREQAVRQAHQDLEEFAFAASHDLKQPLRHIMSYSEILSTQYHDRLDEEGQEMLDILKKSSRRMSGQIDALLEYARIGHQTAVAEPVALADVVTTAAEDAFGHDGTATPAGGVPVRLITAGLPEVVGNFADLIRVFTNLFENALKYGNRDPVVIEIDSRCIGPQWEITVTDNGVGIEPRYADDIFKPFRRLHSHAAKPGSGLGLASARKIIEAHGGQLSLDSSHPQGARFVMTLPASEADRGVEAARAEGGSPLPD